MQAHDACRNDDVDMADAARPPLGPDHRPGPGHRSHGVFGHGRMGSSTPPPTVCSLSFSFSPTTPTVCSLSFSFSPTTPTAIMENQFETANHGAVQRAASSPPSPSSQRQHQTPLRDINSAPTASDDQPDDEQPDDEQPDDDQPDADEFSLSDRSTNRSRSVTPSAYDYTMENGRRYLHSRHGHYPIPNDDDEMEREETIHMLLLDILEGELFVAPIGQNPQRILDVGTGSGAWAVNMGERFPGAYVCGVDLWRAQPEFVPPNVRFFTGDCEEDEWPLHNFDFVHLRFMAVVLGDVPTVLERAFKTLRPSGWIELQELSAEPLCEDGTMLPGDAVKEMFDLAHEAFACFGMNTTLPKHLRPMLVAAGFTNVRCEVKSVPIGTWVRDPKLQRLGFHQKEVVRQLIPVLAGRPFEALELSVARREMALLMARDALSDTNVTNVHRYFNYHFWYAQKPGS